MCVKDVGFMMVVSIGCFVVKFLVVVNKSTRYRFFWGGICVCVKLEFENQRQLVVAIYFVPLFQE